MSYHIYTTEGIVLRQSPLREADRIYSIFTEELGLISATANGVRKESSKLRGSLEPLSLSKISLVKGREYWRITSAIYERTIPRDFVQPFSLLEKLVRGEERNPELFQIIVDSIRQHKEHDQMFEPHLVSRILYHLGYMRREDLNLDKKNLIQAINRGIEASHLV